MSLLLHFSVVKSENGQFQLVELVNSTIITQLDESMVIQHGDGYALKFDGTTKIDIHLDKFGLDLSELRTGRLEIDFNVHRPNLLLWWR